MAGAFDGIRIVEFVSYVSGPNAGMLLADLGADVVEVAEAGKGDPFRGWGRVEDGPTFGSVSRAARTHHAQVYVLVTGDGKPFVIHLDGPTINALLACGASPEIVDKLRALAK